MKFLDMQIVSSKYQLNNSRKIKPEYPEKKIIGEGAFADVYEVQHYKPGIFALK